MCMKYTRIYAGANANQVCFFYLEERVARGLSGGATLVLRLALRLKLPDSGGEFDQLSLLGAVRGRGMLGVDFLLQIEPMHQTHVRQMKASSLEHHTYDAATTPDIKKYLNSRM